MATWQIKNGSVIMAQGSGSLPYSADTLKQMKAAGYRIYVDGKVWKK